MTTPNPFAAHVPTEQQASPAPQPGANPYAQQAPAMPQGPGPQYGAAPAAPNPYTQQPAPAPAAAPGPAQAYAGPQQPAAPNPYTQQPAQQQATVAPAPQYGQTYGGQPAYGPPAAQQQPPAAPQFGPVTSAPEPVIGQGGANLADMYGRLVIAFPHQVETVARPDKYITDADRASGNTHQKRLTATFVVLDAGPGRMDPIWFGGDMTKFPPVPHTESAPLPYVRKALWVRQTRVISQCEPFLPGGPKGGPNGQPGILGGRVHKAGPEHNSPWYLTSTLTPEDLALVNQYLEGVSAGHFPNPLA